MPHQLFISFFLLYYLSCVFIKYIKTNVKLTVFQSSKLITQKKKKEEETNEEQRTFMFL